MTPRERASRAMKVVTAPHDVPWIAYPFGVICLLILGAALYQQRAGIPDKLHLAADGGLLLLAACCFGLVPFVVGQLGSALSLYQQYKAAKANGGAGPTSGGSSQP